MTQCLAFLIGKKHSHISYGLFSFHLLKKSIICSEYHGDTIMITNVWNDGILAREIISKLCFSHVLQVKWSSMLFILSEESSQMFQRTRGISRTEAYQVTFPSNISCIISEQVLSLKVVRAYFLQNITGTTKLASRKIGCGCMNIF